MNNYPPASNSPQPFDSQDRSAPDGQSVRVSLPQSAPYVTYTIIAITGLVYLLQLVTSDLPIGFLAKSNHLIREGELWRLFTPALVHGSLPHILFNMYALLSFGTGLERHFGHGRFFLLYVLGAFAGNVMSFLLTNANSVGASTAIFGLIGAEGIFLLQNRKLFADQFRNAIGNVIFVVVVNLFIGLAPTIDNWGHIGGLLGGLIFTSFAGPVWEIEGISPMYHLEDRREVSGVIIGAVTVLFIFGGLAFWGMVR
ncbi:MAG: rhomboid family intramembrane serine protease [Anaerolineae bacterium]|nr:rhomboid family intramembrane serine protease [Anaerolineae bacterium]MCI0608166.1 rhomboid family intramembrane serine protease [Anaerolineae bacterium]